MKIIGLTGPSGAGKGFCYQYFDSLSIPCIDADRVYHELLFPPSKCVDELVAFFGNDILDNKGGIDRKTLANKVFADKSREKLNTLNFITHKYVTEKIVFLLNKFSKQGLAAAVIDAPLLFEAGVDKMCDFTVAVISDEATRLERIVKRDNISSEEATMRIKAQKPLDFYTESTDYTVTNNADIHALNNQLEAILKKEKIL